MTNNSTGTESSESEIFRLEDLCCLSDGSVVIADHANGILIYTPSFEVGRHLNGDKDTLAFGVRMDPSRNFLVGLILDVPGWTLNFYDVQHECKLVTQIPVPLDPPVPRLKLRWLTVTSEGEIFIATGGIIWKLRNFDAKEWSLVHRDTNAEVWYSLISKIPGTLDKYVVCLNGDSIVKVTINDKGMSPPLQQVVGADLAPELGTYTLDARGNLLVSDWQSGDIKLLDSDYKLVGTVGNAGPGEPSYMATHKGHVYVGCKQSFLVKAFKYLEE